MAFSDMLRTNNMLVGYEHSNNQINHIFNTNSFDVPQAAAEANVWGLNTGWGRSSPSGIW